MSSVAGGAGFELASHPVGTVQPVLNGGFNGTSHRWNAAR